ncbi:MAG: glycosyltransferase family 2 protein, partial [Planctomycetes bacterium]|nr:glycosyltransferase family 2 protein [Planctomycetota bacterium]
MAVNRGSGRDACGASPPLFSVVVPLHDEEGNVTEVVDRCLALFDRRGDPAELILVDDGSSDGTLDELRQAVLRDPRVRAIALRRRFGKGAALAAGIAESRGNLVGTIDGDLQEDPAEFDRLITRVSAGADLVVGWRSDRRDGFWKRSQSHLFNALVRAVTGQRIRDSNCGFKVMHRELATEVALTDGRFRFVPLVAASLGYRVEDVEVTHRPRSKGRSSFGSNRFPGALIDLIITLWFIRYRSRPGHLFIQLGAISGAVGVAICIALTCIRIGTGSIQHRYPLLALGVLLIVVGVQLGATGFLGEWLSQQRGEREPGYRVGWRSSDALASQSAVDEE